MGDQQRLPRYIHLPPDAVDRRDKRTQDGVYDLLPDELLWRDRYVFLLERGYKLRPRYHPDWKPSWTGTNLDPEFCEDAVVSDNPDVLDAVSMADGSCVAIKAVRKGGDEIRISQFLSTLQDSKNHCVPIVDALEDPLDSSKTLMIMRYLLPWDEPELAMVYDVVDFVTQMLEGLAFLHNLRIAHRDIAPQNVMMDGRALYPHGHHPVWRDRSPDAIHDLTPLARIDHPVKYYYVDFGLSVRFSPGQSTLVVGDVGRDAEVPELSSTVPYDAFKADIYALGNFFDKELAQKYLRLEFLKPLIESMKQRRPALRPAADELAEMFGRTRKSRDRSQLRWRLAPRSEPTYERLLNDTVAVAKNGITQLRRFVRPE